MAVPTRIVPRKDAQTDLMNVTPSGRVNFRGMGGGGVPQVRASSAVQQPTPYIGKPAKRTDLFELAEGLQYFNGEIGKLAYTQRQQWEEGQVEKAKTEAITNPEKVAEVFRMGIDKATEQGLFPRYAHPKYRFAYLETGAKNLALSGLPSFLEEKTKGLSSADSTEPIDSTINAYVDEYAASSGIASMPNAYAAFREAAFPSVLRIASARREERENNFNVARLEGLDQNITGLTSNLLSSMSIEKESDRDMATSLAIREIQTVYNNIRRDYPEVDSTKQFTSSFLSSLNSSVTNEELSPREAMQVLQVAASSLKSGTGAWADISDVQTAVSGMMANWENKAANQANLALQQKKQKEELFSEGVRDVFEKRIADGTFTSLNNTTDLEAIGEQVATAVYPEMGVSKDTMRRKVDEIRIETLERIENSEKFFTENPLIENLIDAGEPEEALVYLNANKNAITRETYEKYLKKVNEVNDVKKFLDEGGYSKKLSDIEKIARDRISPDSFITRMMGSQDPLTADDQEKIADLQTYGESTFRELSTQLLRTKLKENPELRQNQVERESAAMDAVNEAWVETQKRMSSYLGKENAVLDAEQSKQKQQLKTQKAALYGTSLRKIDLLEDALDNMKISQDPTSKEIIYETLTTPQNVDFKMRLRQAPLELNSLADKMGRVNPSDPEYNQLKESYNTILGIAGYGAQSIIDGKTEHGMPVNVENIKQNWKNVPIFRNNEEYEAAWKEAREAVAPVTKTKNLLDFVKQAEGFAPKAKWDNKQWSVGYGTRGSQGETLSEVEASARLEQELEGHASAVDTAAEAAGMILTEGQRNALISFAFNTGDSNAISVIKRFAGDPAAMKKKMMEFNKETINGQLVFSQGLQNRRLKEIALFDSTDMTPAMLSAEPSTLEKLFSILGIDTPDEEREFNQRQSMFSRQRTP